MRSGMTPAYPSGERRVTLMPSYNPSNVPDRPSSCSAVGQSSTTSTTFSNSSASSSGIESSASATSDSNSSSETCTGATAPNVPAKTSLTGRGRVLTMHIRSERGSVPGVGSDGRPQGPSEQRAPGRRASVGADAPLPIRSRWPGPRAGRPEPVGDGGAVGDGGGAPASTAATGALKPAPVEWSEGEAPRRSELRRSRDY